MEKRSLLALALSFLVLFGYQIFSEIFYPPPPPQPVSTEAPAADPTAPVTTGQPVASPVVNSGLPAVVEEGPSITFENKVMKGKISLKGARIIEVDFLDYLDVQGPDGKPIRFLNITGDAPYLAETGFLAGSDLPVPNRNTIWKPVGAADLQGGGELRLQWDSGKGLVFEKVIALPAEGHLFTITDRVTVTGQVTGGVHHFAQFLRVEPHAIGNNMATPADFEGPMGFLDGIRHTFPYADVREAERTQKGTVGWNGISDQYFLAALIPDDKGEKRFYFDFDTPFHRVGEVSPKQELAAGQSVQSSVRFYIGPKAVTQLESLHLDLERAIDYGWFHFLARPLLDLLLLFQGFLHNLGLAIILLTILIKALFYPLADKSFRSMNEMKKLQPKVEELRKRFAEDKQRLNEEMMALYRDHKVNPFGGCLPILVQIPVFFALYKVLYLSIEMRHAPFFLWITDLSAMDPYYVLPLIMGGTMFIQSKLNPTPADPVQAKVMLFLPVIFTVMFFSFPSGLVLYWVVSNILSIIQQAMIAKKNA